MRVRTIAHGAGLLVAVVTSVACGDDGAGSTTASTTTLTSLPDSALEQMATDVGCESLTESENPYWETRWGFDESLDCVLEGRPSVRLHSFAPERLGDVRQRLSTRVGAPGNPCPDGSQGISPYLVLGAEWAIATNRQDLAQDLARRLGGEVLAGGGSDGPPVSYPSVDPCPA